MKGQSPRDSGKSGNLIQSYDLELVEPQCAPGAAVWEVEVRLQDDISEALPLLNAQLKRAQYNHEQQILTWADSGRRYALRPNEIVAGPVEDSEEGHRFIEDFVAVVNDIWKRRGEIEPNFKLRKIPSIMEVYQLLPRRTKCNECGYGTCLAYAAGVIEGSAELSGCSYLSEESRNSISSLFDKSV